MDEGDAIIRLMVLGGFATGLVLLLVGGFLTRAAGQYVDGTHTVMLHQLGPVVWGEADVPGGSQTYRGRAAFGRIWLRRHDSGIEHLQAMGFTLQQAPWMRGQTTANLLMKSDADGLHGEFFGRKFSFDDEGIRNVEKVLPAPRVWRRLPTSSL